MTSDSSSLPWVTPSLHWSKICGSVLERTPRSKCQPTTHHTTGRKLTKDADTALLRRKGVVFISAGLSLRRERLGVMLAPPPSFFCFQQEWWKKSNKKNNEITMCSLPFIFLLPLLCVFSFNFFIAAPGQHQSQRKQETLAKLITQMSFGTLCTYRVVNIWKMMVGLKVNNSNKEYRSGHRSSVFYRLCLIIHWWYFGWRSNAGSSDSIILSCAVY